MYTLNQIKKFEAWKNSCGDPDSVGLNTFINFNYNPEDILILGKLFFPEFIEVERCIFFSESYNEKIHLAWKEKLNSDCIAIEKAMNHVHVYDLFSNCQDDVEEAVFEQVANLLKLTWTLSAKQSFPDKDIEVHVYNDEQDYGPTLVIHQKSRNQESNEDI